MNSLVLALVLVAAEPAPDPVPVLTFTDLVPVNAARMAEKKDPVPVHRETVTRLLGKRVKVDGFMMPTAKQHVSRFCLSGDCCNTRPKPEDWVVIELRPSREVKFTTKPITVEGTLIVTDAESTKIGVYYQLTDAEVSGPNTEVRHVQKPSPAKS